MEKRKDCTKYQVQCTKYKVGNTRYEIRTETNVEHRRPIAEWRSRETLKNASTRISNQAEFSLISWFLFLASTLMPNADWRLLNWKLIKPLRHIASFLCAYVAKKKNTLSLRYLMFFQCRIRNADCWVKKQKNIQLPECHTWYFVLRT